MRRWGATFTCTIPGVNFINVLRTDFTLVGPESVKRYWRLNCIFCAFGIYERKSCTLNIDEINPSRSAKRQSNHQYLCALLGCKLKCWWYWPKVMYEKKFRLTDWLSFQLSTNFIIKSLYFTFHTGGGGVIIVTKKNYVLFILRREKTTYNA